MDFSTCAKMKLQILVKMMTVFLVALLAFVVVDAGKCLLIFFYRNAGRGTFIFDLVFD